VTLRFEYRADDRTLRDEEVDAIHWPLVKALQEKFAAEIRTVIDHREKRN